MIANIECGNSDSEKFLMQDAPHDIRDSLDGRQGNSLLFTQPTESETPDTLSNPDHATASGINEAHDHQSNTIIDPGMRKGMAMQLVATEILIGNS